MLPILLALFFMWLYLGIVVPSISCWKSRRRIRVNKFSLGPVEMLGRLRWLGFETVVYWVATNGAEGAIRFYPMFGIELKMKNLVAVRWISEKGTDWIEINHEVIKLSEYYVHDRITSENIIEGITILNAGKNTLEYLCS